MNGADTLRVLNRTVERLNELEEKYRRADWARMVLMAALSVLTGTTPGGTDHALEVRANAGKAVLQMWENHGV